MKPYPLLILVVGIGLMFGPRAVAQLAQTTPCPPGARGSQNTASGKSPQSKTTSTQAPSNKSAPAKNASIERQAERKGNSGHNHDGTGVGVGVGVNVDLGGIGQRKAEPDPFAATNRPSTTTQEKPKAKKADRSVDTPFDKVKLTGEQAKSLP